MSPNAEHRDVRRPIDTDERGQAMPIVVMLGLVLLLAVGIAVDIGSWYNRASDIQRAADVAALAGAQVRGTGGTEAEAAAEVRAVLAANGIDVSSPELVIQISQPLGNDVNVAITDGTVPMYFAGIVLDDVQVSRESTATVGGCLGSCETPFVLQPPVTRIPVNSQGDGFTPTLAGNEVYTLNHHTDSWNDNAWWAKELVCVDLVTEAMCEGYPQAVDGVTADYTQVSHYIPEQQIWFTVQKYTNSRTRTELGFECHDMATNTSCGRFVKRVWNYGPRADSRWDRYTWGSQAKIVGDRIFMIDGEVSILCHDMRTDSNCAGYPKEPAQWQHIENRELVTGRTNWPKEPDVELHDGKLYFSYSTEQGDYLMCFDPAIDNACSTFNNAARFHNNWASSHPHIFISTDSNGTPNGICLNARENEIPCVGFNGNSSFNRNDIRANYPFSWSTHELRHGHLAFFGGYRYDTTTCIDLRDGSNCGEIQDNHRPYGYTKLPEIECFIGLGHNSIFFTFTTTMDPCPTGKGATRLFPCDCANGGVFWGTAEVDQAFIDQFDTFVIEILDPNGNVVLGPLDLVQSGGTIDLTDISPNIPYLDIRFEAEVPLGQVWDEKYTSTLTVTERPTLRN